MNITTANVSCQEVVETRCGPQRRRKGRTTNVQVRTRNRCDLKTAIQPVALNDISMRPQTPSRVLAHALPTTQAGWHLSYNPSPQRRRRSRRWCHNRLGFPTLARSLARSCSDAALRTTMPYGGLHRGVASSGECSNRLAGCIIAIDLHHCSDHICWQHNPCLFLKTGSEKSTLLFIYNQGTFGFIRCQIARLSASFVGEVSYTHCYTKR